MPMLLCLGILFSAAFNLTFHKTRDLVGAGGEDALGRIRGALMHLLHMQLRAELSALQHCACVSAELRAHCAGWVSLVGPFSLIRGGQRLLGEWAGLISSVVTSP